MWLNMMRHKKCPCIKCILLAICRHRVVIKCDILDKFRQTTHKNGTGDHEKFWQAINKILPEAGFIFDEKDGDTRWAMMETGYVSNKKQWPM